MSKEDETDVDTAESPPNAGRFSSNTGICNTIIKQKNTLYNTNRRTHVPRRVKSFYRSSTYTLRSCTIMMKENAFIHHATQWLDTARLGICENIGIGPRSVEKRIVGYRRELGLRGQLRVDDDGSIILDETIKKELVRLLGYLKSDSSQLTVTKTFDVITRLATGESSGDRAMRRFLQQNKIESSAKSYSERKSSRQHLIVAATCALVIFKDYDNTSWTISSYNGFIKQIFLMCSNSNVSFYQKHIPIADVCWILEKLFDSEHEEKALLDWEKVDFVLRHITSMFDTRSDSVTWDLYSTLNRYSERTGRQGSDEHVLAFISKMVAGDILGKTNLLHLTAISCYSLCLRADRFRTDPKAKNPPLMNIGQNYARARVIIGIVEGLVGIPELFLDVESAVASLSSLAQELREESSQVALILRYVANSFRITVAYCIAHREDQATAEYYAKFMVKLILSCNPDDAAATEEALRNFGYLFYWCRCFDFSCRQILTSGLEGTWFVDLPGVAMFFMMPNFVRRCRLIR